jgi:Zn-dependent peptidase ImmA (M78 family)
MFFLNGKVSGERHRFNIAHELGHSVMHFSTAMGDAEDEANAFAQEFLMPKAECRSDLKDLDLSAALRLKRVWGVSMAAIIRRAKDLKVISTDKYRRLNTQLGMNNMRLVEPEPLPIEQPELFDKLLKLHREKLAYTPDEMRRLMFTEKLGELPVPQVPQMRLVGLFDQMEG